MQCPRCQTENPDNARFCFNCGQAFERRCASCETILAPGARFCMACGQPVLEQTPADAHRFNQLTAAVPMSLVEKIRLAEKARPAIASGGLGERRTITALSMDVVGSTRLAGLLEVETWSNMLNTAFEKAAAVIYSHEGTIVRLLGDTLLAFFGAPVAHEDDPIRAVRAGLEIIEQMQEYSTEIEENHHVSFAIRVCIHTGPVTTGALGDDLKLDFTSSGETVNLASRMKFACPPMGILVSQSTYRITEPYFDCVDMQELTVKDLPEPVRVYQVKAARVVVGRTRGFTDLYSPMVGRDQELAELMQLCDTIRLGMGRAVLIAGEPGMGKTRLVQEWQRAAEAYTDSHQGIQVDGKLPYGHWTTGRCFLQGQGTAYQLLADWLKNLMGVSMGSEEWEIDSALQELTRNLFGDRMMEVYPFLGRILSLNLEGSAYQTADISDPLALQNQYLMAVQRLVEAFTVQAPLILVLEDLHWADGSSIEVFIKLLPLVSRLPVLFCLVSRPDRDAPGWKLVSEARALLGSSLTEIILINLTQRDSLQMVENLLDIEALPTRTRELILRKSDGNPFYLEELIRMLIDRGIIVQQNGVWTAQRELSEHDIPENLTSLLMARIDRLPADARFTLLVASVIGRNFPVKVLSRVMERSRYEFVQ